MTQGEWYDGFRGGKIPDKSVGNTDSTPMDEVRESIIKGIIEARRLAISTALRANTVFINKRYFKIKSFLYENNDFGYYTSADFPPMIGGMAAYFTDEIPDEYAFLVTEGDEPEIEKLRRENAELRQTIEEIKKVVYEHES